MEKPSSSELGYHQKIKKYLTLALESARKVYPADSFHISRIKQALEEKIK